MSMIHTLVLLPNKSVQGDQHILDLVVTTRMCLHMYTWYPLGIGSRTPVDTKAHTHSSPFVKNCVELA